MVDPRLCRKIINAAVFLESSVLVNITICSFALGRVSQSEDMPLCAQDK
jgi:hypothetical protein